MSMEERKLTAGIMSVSTSAPVYASQPGKCSVDTVQVHKIQIYVKDSLWAMSDESRGIVDKKFQATASRLLDEVNGRRGLPRQGRYDVSFSECHFDGAQGMVALAGTYPNGVSDYFLPGTNLSLGRVDADLKLYFPDGPPSEIHLMLKQCDS